MTGKGSGRRGRPIGFRLSEASKRSISISKTGQRHSERTKEKISRSLIRYFRNKNPLSDDIINRYCRTSDDRLCDWMKKSQNKIDSCSDVLTSKTMKNKTKIEICCGSNIELFSHNITPELIVMFKEYCEIEGLRPEDVL